MRRWATVLAAGGSSLLWGAVDARDASEELPPTLRELGDRAGLEVGAAVAWEPLQSDPDYAALAGSQFHVLTPENALKWAPLEHVPGRLDRGRADAILAFAQANQQTVRGHALVWDLEIPSWVDVADRASLETAQAAHLDRTVRAYAGRVEVWDVVNEALDAQGQLKPTPMMRQVGPSYIADAFAAAHRADPAARLFYNDHAVLWPGPKASGLLRLVDALQAADVPLHGVGLQGHLHLVPEWELDWAGIEAQVEALGGRGLEVHLSEVDVRVADLDGSRHGRLLAQAQTLHRLVDLCRRQPACTRVTFWGFTDRYSWVDRQLGPDDPLLWDDQLAEKPALRAVRQALLGQPWSECGHAQVESAGLEMPIDRALRTGRLGSTGPAPQHSPLAARTGERGLRVEGRTQVWQGPLVELTPWVSEGLEWRLGGHVRTTAGAPLELTLRIEDGAGSRSIGLAEAEATGDWQRLEARHRFTLTEPVDRIFMYVEGPPPGAVIDLDDILVEVACEGRAPTG